MKRTVLICSVFLLILFNGYDITWAAGGCCSFGGSSSAPGGGNIEALPKGTGEIRFTFSYSYRDKLLDKKDEVQNSTGIVIKNRMFSISAMYGIAEQINLGINIPYVKNEKRKSLPYYKEKGDGIGDITITSRYILVKPAPVGEIVPYVELALKIPTGKEETDSDVQVGAGSWDPSIGAGFNYTWWDLFTYGRVNYSVSIGQSGVDGETVDSLNALLGLEYQLIRYVDVSLSMDYSRKTLRKIGGTWIYIRPGISFGPWENFSIYSTIGFPVYRHVYYPQSAEDYQLDIGLVWGF